MYSLNPLNWILKKYQLKPGQSINKENALIYIEAGSVELKNDLENVDMPEGKSYYSEVPFSLHNPSVSEAVIHMLDGCDALRNDQLQRVSPESVVPLFHQVMRLQQSGLFCDGLRKTSLLFEILAKLSEPVTEDWERLKQYIDDHLHEALTVQDLAKRAGMTPPAFSRAFKKAEGVSPKEYFLTKRIRLCKETIAQYPQTPVKKHAEALGFQDEFYFSRFFKKHTGYSPREFATRFQPKVAVVSQLFLQDHLLSLGIQPVMAPGYPSEFEHGGLPSYLRSELEGTALFHAEKPLYFTDVMYRQPDYIFKTALHEEGTSPSFWEQDDRVKTIPFQKSWEDYLLLLAVQLGKRVKAEKVIREVKEQENRTRSNIAAAVKGTWAIIWIRQNDIRLYGRNSHACSQLFYDALGFQPCKGLPEKEYRTISLSELYQIDPEHILVLWSRSHDIQRVAIQKEWNELSAVKENCVYYPKSQEWDPWGPKGRMHMLREIEQFFNLKHKL
ncbi:AraC family transcriptional regulator [Jeotgalibacillus aurantiacus]|uniref:AraC family transcriptional regulator n=1 Tax=Jeotgalibacillus aurantiacus TaxID=2763266 RepID=UPI001D0BAF30|nr:AraC family transcriptional regulator [Jeotgalibacillus aurantiacus]